MVASATRPSWAIVIVRVGVGALLLAEALELWGRGVGPWIVEETAYRIALAPDAYAWFGQQVVLRLPTVFAWLIVGGTSAAAASFFVGAALRPASVGLLLLMLNVYFAGPQAQREYALLVALCALACFVANAGQRLGIDRWLPNAVTWSRLRWPWSKRGAAPR